MRKIQCLLFAVSFFYFVGFCQTPAARKLDCAAVQFWQSQLANGFKGIQQKRVDETEITSNRKINGFEECSYRMTESSGYTYVDGRKVFMDKNAALALYRKLKSQIALCLTAQRYKAYPEEKEDDAQFQVFVKNYGKKGGYYQIRVTMQPAVKYENDKEMPNGFEVLLVMELRKEGAAG